MTATLPEEAVAEEAVAEEAPEEVISDATRLRLLFSSSVPPAIDHSACEHPPTDSARRACRRRKLRETGNMRDSALFITGPGGETYIAESLVRAEVLYTAHRQGWCQDGQNRTLKRLSMPLVTYGRVHTTLLDVDATLVRLPRDHYRYGATAFNREHVLRAIERVGTDWSPDWSVTLLDYGDIPERTVVMDGEEVISETTRTIRRARIRVIGPLTLNSGWTEEQNRRYIKDHIDGWSAYWMGAHVERINSFEVRPAPPQQHNDQELFDAYVELLGLPTDR